MISHMYFEAFNMNSREKVAYNQNQLKKRIASRVVKKAIRFVILFWKQLVHIFRKSF